MDQPTLLHLDLPAATPVYGEFEIRGWAASRTPLRRVFVEQPGDRIEFAFSERPDVRAAYPSHPYAAGFSGSLTGNFIRAHRVAFSVETDAGVTSQKITTLTAATPTINDTAPAAAPTASPLVRSKNRVSRTSFAEAPRTCARMASISTR